MTDPQDKPLVVSMFAAQQNLTPEGTVYGRDIVNAASDGAVLRYYEVWLPVRETHG